MEKGPKDSFDLSHAQKVNNHPALQVLPNKLFSIHVIIYTFAFFLVGLLGFLVALGIKTDNKTLFAQNLITPAPSGSASSKKEVVGFLPSWNAAQKVQIQTNNFSQIIYFGLGVSSYGDLIKYDDKNVPVLEWSNFDSSYFRSVQAQAKETNTKVLITIKNLENKSIDTLISSTNYTNNFINQVQSLIKKYQLDGINFDFEYFTDSQFPTKDYLNSFLTKVSQTLKKDNPLMVISVDVNATVVLHDRAYDMVKIGEIADQVILMGYDYQLPTSPYAGSVSPLYESGNNPSIDRSIRSLLGRVQPEKIILAIPLYGYEWETSGAYYKSPTYQNTGALATYKRIRQLIDNRSDVKKQWDTITHTPWLSYTQSGAIKQIYYEDERSLSDKLQYVKAKSLGGVAFWALGYEGNNQEMWNVVQKL